MKELNYKYKAMENKFLNEIEASKGSKRLLQKEVEMLMNSLVSKITNDILLEELTAHTKCLLQKSYDEEEKQLQSNFDAQKIERIQNLEKLLAEYKETLDQSETRAINIQNIQQKQEYPEFSELNLHSSEVMRRNEELNQGIYH